MTSTWTSLSGVLLIALSIQFVLLRQASANPASTYANHRQGRPHVPRPVICNICSDEKFKAILIHVMAFDREQDRCAFSAVYSTLARVFSCRDGPVETQLCATS